MQILPEFNTSFLGIVMFTFIGVVAFQLIYLIVFQLRLLLHKSKIENTTNLPSVSVIICARNEEDNLFKNLPIILEQDYPNFEVIVVNDQSQDDSMHIIKAYKKKYPFVKYIGLEKNKHRHFGKKLPLTIGIKGAKNELIIVTDADCQPTSKQWLKQMAKNYTDEKELVLGYSPYSKEKGFLNMLIRFDTTAIAITYLSFAKTALTYMGVGRNMAYAKATFENNGGFKNHYQIASGDDDLFVKEIANRKNVAIELSPESFVYTEPKKTWAKWISQKQRHFTTAPKYRLINKIFLGILPLSMLILYITFFILLFNTEWTIFVLALFGIRLLFYWVVNGLLLKKLEMKDLVWCFPCFEIIHTLVMPFIYYSNPRSEQSKW